MSDTAQRPRFSAADIANAEQLKERNRLLFCGVLVYGAIAVVGLLAVAFAWHARLACLSAIACAGVSYASYAAQLMGVKTQTAFGLVIGSVLLGVLAFILLSLGA